MIKKPSPVFTAVLCGTALLAVIAIASCSPTEGKFTLAWNYEPAGKVTTYKLETHRVGTYYQDLDDYSEDIDAKSEADIIYTVKEILADGTAFVEEINRWTWDEKIGDTAQIKRTTREYIYDLHTNKQGKILTFRLHRESSPGWLNYVRQYYEQCIPVFPEEPISIDYSWTQDVSAMLPDSTYTDVSTKYTIKGRARKMGYDCAIIEYKGNCALSITRNPADSADHYRVDRIEYSGMLYFAIDGGMPVQSEEKRRVVSESHIYKWPQFTKGPDGEKVKIPPEKREKIEINSRTELEEVISYKLVSIEGT